MNSNEGTQYPLRERRRQRSRQALFDSARALFASRGFSDTTMAEIADRAELHVQTLYRHFPTKHALHAALEIESFREAFGLRDPDTFAFWLSYVESSARAVMTGVGGPQQFLQYVRARAEPKLTAARAEIRIECTDVLATGIAEDFPAAATADSMLPILIANMLWGGNADAVRRWSQDDGQSDLVALTTTVAQHVESIARRLLHAASTDDQRA